MSDPGPLRAQGLQAAWTLVSCFSSGALVSDFTFLHLVFARLRGSRTSPESRLGVLS